MKDDLFLVIYLADSKRWVLSACCLQLPLAVNMCKQVEAVFFRFFSFS